MKTNNTKEKILILGGSGMIGNYLTEHFIRDYPNISLVSTYTSVPHYEGAIQFDMRRDDVAHVVESVQPTVIFNLLPGFDETTRNANARLISIAHKRSLRYVFMSTSLVFSDFSHAHDELDTISGDGAYGMFKAICEKEISETLDNYVIFRISATHGARRDSQSRTERFLRRIALGERVEVDSGVIQNRLWTGDLVSMISVIALSEVRGVCHLGTMDSSSESSFLQRLATAFGYDESLVIPRISSERNLVVTPAKALTVPSVCTVHESDTIQHLTHDPKLVRYIKTI